MSQEIREEVLKLIEQKDKIEKEIQLLTAILTQNGIGMSEPLVDPEGFPLNSVDVYQVRNARHRIICLQNDHKSIMHQIENGLQGYYTAAAVDRPVQDTPVNMEVVMNPHTVPFTRVDLVSEGSPADVAGLHCGDQLVEFGSVNADNFKNMVDIATVVQHSENNPISVRLKRGARIVGIQLVPRKWHGKGLLGCTIVPIK